MRIRIQMVITFSLWNRPERQNTSMESLLLQISIFIRFSFTGGRMIYIYFYFFCRGFLHFNNLLCLRTAIYAQVLFMQIYSNPSIIISHFVQTVYMYVCAVFCLLLFSPHRTKHDELADEISARAMSCKNIEVS